MTLSVERQMGAVVILLKKNNKMYLNNTCQHSLE